MIATFVIRIGSLAIAATSILVQLLLDGSGYRSRGSKRFDA